MPSVNIHVKNKYARGGFVKRPEKWQSDLMNITHLRKLRGITQVELAELANVTQPTISRAEKGDDGSTLAVFRAIAEALGVPLADLFSEGRSRAENELLTAFRSLSPDRQRGWLDLARTVLAEAEQPDPGSGQTAHLSSRGSRR